MDGAGALGEDGADGLVIQLAAPGTFGVLDPCENSVFAYMKVEMRRVSYNNVYHIPVQYFVQPLNDSQAVNAGLVSKNCRTGYKFHALRRSHLTKDFGLAESPWWVQLW